MKASEEAVRAAAGGWGPGSESYAIAERALQRSYPTLRADIMSEVLDGMLGEANPAVAKEMTARLERRVREEVLAEFVQWLDDGKGIEELYGLGPRPRRQALNELIERRLG